MPVYETIELHFRPIAGAKVQHLSIPVAPINVFVGPNSSGKSTAINELAGVRREHLVVCDRSVLGRETEAALRLFVRANPQFLSTYEYPRVKEIVEAEREGTRFIARAERQVRTSLDSILRQIHQEYESAQRVVLSVSNSLGLIAKGGRGRLKFAPQSRLDALFRDDGAGERFKALVHEMFGLYPVIDALHGELQLRLSSQPLPENVGVLIQRENEEFLDAALTPDALSDGTRSYIGLWGHLLSGKERLVFLDEAGAFLHPPLARKLGKQLTQLAIERDGHVFAATHSPDFVFGCVQAGCQSNVIRLTYRDGVSTARLLSTGDLLPLMRDPLLRSANILSGLFHDGVVVCEADSDRAFYQEINERLLDRREGLESCHFVNAQNWQTIPRIVRALRRLGIPAALLVDLDAVIHDDARMLLEAAGVPETITRSMGQMRGDLARGVDDRRQLKLLGLNAVAAGEREGWEKYLRDLAEYGIFAVPVGELEGWFPELEIPRADKKQWIVDMFARMGSDPGDAGYVRPAAGGPWDFVRAIARWILEPRRRGMPQLVGTELDDCP
ncbi:ATP-dependent nuclease [Nannocystis punicea]|uniref:AAA family ATPase n=1 Tax=Nannocystis punicea TaxID=2995304 RepID=A0ABY7GTG7_9BACT|nr:AAA family ATPase [Nannocystis poenicansa]WAS90203.1 AAA family ATPase [Nannocystis poenicansa]